MNFTVAFILYSGASGESLKTQGLEKQHSCGCISEKFVTARSHSVEMWHVGNQFQGVSEKWQGNRLGVRKKATVQWVTTHLGSGHGS